jgi:hypothetical protein
MQHLSGRHSLANLDPFQDWTKEERDLYEALNGRHNDTGALWPASLVSGLLAPQKPRMESWRYV